MSKSKLHRVGVLENRNGRFEIAAIKAWGGSDNWVYVEGIGMRGVAVRGGFTLYSPEVLDAFCKEYLRQREARAKIQVVTSITKEKV